MQRELKPKNNSHQLSAGDNYRLRRVIVISYLFLVIIASLGALLRILPFTEINLSYTNLIHAHSHGAFLGWLFLANFAISGYLIRFKFTVKTIICLVADILLLFFTIPLFVKYGYNYITIILSTLHVIASTYLAGQLIKTVGFKNLISFNGFKSYLVLAWTCLIISGIFPLILGVIVKIFGAASPAYYNTIYTYLHFQYNGFFISGILAALHFYKGTENNPNLKNAYILFALSVPLSLANSYLWCKPGYFFNVISFLAILLQLAAFILLLNKKLLAANLSIKIPVSPTWIIYGLIFKSIMQLSVSFPQLAELASLNRYLILFYLHFVLLGIISIPTIKITASILKIEERKYFNLAMRALLLVFFITQLLMAYKAAEMENLWQNSDATMPVLAIVSCLFPLILISILFVSLRTKPKAS